MKFTCPACTQPLEADSSMEGMTINCPSCETKLQIPMSASPLGHDPDMTRPVTLWIKCPGIFYLWDMPVQVLLDGKHAGMVL